MADKQAERIKFETEMLRFTALIATATGGGSISLLLGELTLLRLILAGVGVIVTIGLTTVVWWQRRLILKLIGEIKEVQ